MNTSENQTKFQRYHQQNFLNESIGQDCQDQLDHHHSFYQKSSLPFKIRPRPQTAKKPRNTTNSVHLKTNFDDLNHFPYDTLLNVEQFKKTKKSLAFLVENMFNQFKSSQQQNKDTIVDVEQVLKKDLSFNNNKKGKVRRPQSAYRRPLKEQKNRIRSEEKKDFQIEERKEEKREQIGLNQRVKIIKVIKDPNHDDRNKQFKNLLLKLDPKSDVDIKQAFEDRVSKKNITQSLDSKIHPKRRYEIQETLGTGSHAVVRKAIDTLTNNIVAIKSFEKSKMHSLEKKYICANEIRILQKLDHPNIIKLITILSTQRITSIVLEYIGNQSLYQMLKERNPRRVPETEFLPVYLQILSAIAYCHENKIVHRDIKIENILLNFATKEVSLIILRLNQLRIIDFSLSCQNDIHLTTYCGTPSYMSPEIVTRKPYNGEKADVWALGVVLYVTLSGKFPFIGKNEEELFKQIIRCQAKIPHSFSNKTKFVLEAIFIKDQTQRPSVKQIINQLEG